MFFRQWIVEAFPELNQWMTYSFLLYSASIAARTMKIGIGEIQVNVKIIRTNGMEWEQLHVNKFRVQDQRGKDIL